MYRQEIQQVEILTRDEVAFHSGRRLIQARTTHFFGKCFLDWDQNYLARANSVCSGSSRIL